MTTSLRDLWPSIERAALEHGALAAGVSGIEDAHGQLFRDWIEGGHHASMAWLEKNQDARINPHSRFPWARSVIAITVPYAPERPATSSSSLASRIARYAQGDDYHEVLDDILRTVESAVHAQAPDAQTRRYVDTGPLSDRAYAAQSGLGWIGRNGMLIDPVHGSWLFIGTLLTSLENDLTSEEVADRCGQCTKCLDACPTDAILPGRLVDSNRCISHATIEQRGAISDSIKADLAGNVFGCDICQEVCPWNATPAPGHPAFTPRATYQSMPVHALIQLSQADFSSLFRRSAIKRAKRAGMIRNAILVSDTIDDAVIGAVADEGDTGIIDAVRWIQRRQ